MKRGTRFSNTRVTRATTACGTCCQAPASRRGRCPSADIALAAGRPRRASREADAPAVAEGASSPGLGADSNDTVRARGPSPDVGLGELFGPRVGVDPVWILSGDPKTSVHLDKCSGIQCFSGGAEGQNRTADTMIFSHVLYRLSYLGTSKTGRGTLRFPGSNVAERAASVATTLPTYPTARLRCNRLAPRGSPPRPVGPVVNWGSRLVTVVRHGLPGRPFVGADAFKDPALPAGRPTPPRRRRTYRRAP